MNSRRYNSRKKNKAYKNTTLVVLFILILFLLNAIGNNPLTGISYGIAKPIWKVQEIIYGEISALSSLLKSKKALYKENKDLKQSIKEQENTLILNTTLEAENKELKMLLGRDIENKAILASVLNKPNTSPYDTLIIDIGSTDNVHVGDKAVVFGDFVVGFISKVFRSTSQVTLFSSPGQETNIIIGEDNITATALGRGGNNFITEIPRDIEIEVNDVITLAGIDTQVFAVVEKIIRKETDPFQVIMFKNPVNVNNLKWVQVLRNRNDI